MLQTFGATATCMAVGFTWYSEAFFGKIWRSHVFPGVAYGNCAGIKNKTNALVLPPFSTTIMGTICQNAILTFTINTLLPVFLASDPKCVGLCFPLTFAAIAAGVCACVSYPHYAYPRRPFITFLIGTGHDTVQLFAAVFLIYFLSNK